MQGFICRINRLLLDCSHHIMFPTHNPKLLCRNVVHLHSAQLKSPRIMPTSVEMSLSLTFQANIGESQPEWGKPQWHCRPTYSTVIWAFVFLWHFDANPPAWWCADRCLLNSILQNGERFVALWFDSIKIQKESRLSDCPVYYLVCETCPHVVASVKIGTRIKGSRAQFISCQKPMGIEAP